MECPDCGYMLDAFQTDCPRCQRMAAKRATAKALPPMPAAPPVPPPAPPAAPSQAAPPPSPAPAPAAPAGTNPAGGIITALISIAVLWWVFSGLFGGGSSTDTVTPTGEVVAADNVTILSSDMVTGEYGIKSIEGEAVNNGTATLPYVQIEFNLYDASGAQVGSTMTNVNNLEPGVKWKFSAGVLEDRAVSYKVKGITAF